jgi:hypothetical protein
MGLQPTIPVFEREKMVDALDRAATVIGSYGDLIHINCDQTVHWLQLCLLFLVQDKRKQTMDRVEADH